MVSFTTRSLHVSASSTSPFSIHPFSARNRLRCWPSVGVWWLHGGCAFLGVLLALSARVGSQRKIEANELVWPISKLLRTMGILAAAAGFVGYMLGSRTAIAPPPWVSAALPPTKHARFMADWWAHNTSYLSGYLGGIRLCVATIRKRLIRERDAIIVISNAVE